MNDFSQKVENGQGEVALQPVLLQLQKEFPDVLVLAYCGDKNLIGDAPRVSLPTSAVAGC